MQETCKVSISDHRQEVSSQGSHASSCRSRDRVPDGPKPLKAYKNQDFLNSHEGRLIRVMCELQEPGHRLERQQVENLVIFLGSGRAKDRPRYEAALSKAETIAKDRPDDEQAQAALKRLQKQAFLVPLFDVVTELARRLTEWSTERAQDGKAVYVVGTGAGPGLMEAANKGAWEANGPSVGFGISMPFEDRLNPYVTPELGFEFHYFFTRKFWMCYKCMGLVVPPGGLATCDQLFEVMTLLNTGKIKRKMPVVLIGKKYWKECINWDAFVEYGTVSEADAKQLHFVDTADEAFAVLTQGIEEVEKKEAGMPFNPVLHPKKSLAEEWLVTKKMSVTNREVAAKDVIVIVGPSGVGKSTLLKRLMSEYEGRFGFSVSHTTRGPRPGEADGVHYNFTPKDRMLKSIAKGAFIEHAEVHGNLYGTSFDAVQRVVSRGQVCLLDIDVQGAKQMKNATLDAITEYIFIAPPDMDQLEKRLRSRGTETEDRILLRLENARAEWQFAKDNPNFFGKILVNNDLEEAYRQFKAFMEDKCNLRPRD